MSRLFTVLNRASLILTFLMLPILILKMPSFALGSLPSAPQSVYQFKWVWRDEQGKVVRLSNWQGVPLIVGMAYTSCRMYCPLTIRQLKVVEKELEKKSKKLPQVIFVTFDPVRDTPNRLLEYKKSWNVSEDRWHFLAGSKDDTAQLGQWLKIHFRETDEHFIHDNKIVVLNEKGEIVKTLEGWDSLESSAF